MYKDIWDPSLGESVHWNVRIEILKIPMQLEQLFWYTIDSIDTGYRVYTIYGIDSVSMDILTLQVFGASSLCDY